jgi:mono/diheme cytochrome c family protein
MSPRFLALTLACEIAAGVAGLSAQIPESKDGVNLIESLQGPALFKAYCAACHGSNGKGGGPISQSLKIPPPDLTKISLRNHGKFPASRIEKTITGEEPLAASHGTREMPLWGPIFSQVAWDQDLGRVRVYNLVQYLKSLQPK